MSQRDQLLGLIDQLYAAPGNHAAWQAFLMRLCDEFEGTGCHFLSHNLHARSGSVEMTARTDPDAVKLYQEHWAAFDPWAYSPGLANVKTGSVVLGDELVPHTQMKRTAYYSEFGQRFDLVRCVAGIIEMAPGAVSCLSINRGDAQEPFEAEHVQALTALVPHLRRALQFHRRLTSAGDAAPSGIAVLNHLHHGVFLFAKANGPCFANVAAEEVLRQCDGLTLEDGVLRADSPAYTTRLRGLIWDALQTGLGRGIGSGGVMTIPRPSGKRPFIVVVSPLSFRVGSVIPASPAAVVFVTDPEHVTAPTEERLRVALGLTPREAALVRLLVEGKTLSQAASELGLALETVRTRLKRILEKTRTHRQSELVRLALLSMPLVR